MKENHEPSKRMTNYEIKAYIDSLMKGDYQSCLKYMREYLNSDPDFIDLYEKIFKKSLYAIGELWEYNKISVATEHLATTVTETLLNHMYEDIYSANKIEKKVVLACTENEDHQVGLRMVADVFENCGWETLFLGANMPAGELIKFIKDNHPDLIALSLSVYYNFLKLEKTVKMIREEFPELPIMIGGQAFRHGGKEILTEIGNVIFIDDLYYLKKYLHC